MGVPWIKSLGYSVGAARVGLKNPIYLVSYMNGTQSRMLFWYGTPYHRTPLVSVLRAHNRRNE